MKFPMQMQHRSDPHSSVVVANQEQYDALPEEYKPESEAVKADAPKRGRPAADKAEE